MLEDQPLDRLRAGACTSTLIEEAIELRLGQRVGALRLDGVLRGDDEERTPAAARDAVGGDRQILHRLEQRALRLGGRAVDLVGQEELREDRALVEDEAVFLLVEHVAAGDVARHQIGRELDALEGGAEHVREGAHEQRLAEAGHAFDEHVTAGEDGDERVQDEIVLAEEHLAGLAAEEIEAIAEFESGSCRLSVGGSLLTGRVEEALELAHELEVGAPPSRERRRGPRARARAARSDEGGAASSRAPEASTSTRMTSASGRPVRAAIASASGMRPCRPERCTRSRRRSSAQRA